MDLKLHSPISWGSGWTECCPFPAVCQEYIGIYMHQILQHVAPTRSWQWPVRSPSKPHTSPIYRAYGQEQKCRISHPRAMSSSWSSAGLEHALGSHCSVSIPFWLYEAQMNIVIFQKEKLDTQFISDVYSLQAKRFRVTPPEALRSPAAEFPLQACYDPSHQYFLVKSLQMNTMKANKQTGELLIGNISLFLPPVNAASNLLCLQGWDKVQTF